MKNQTFTEDNEGNEGGGMLHLIMKTREILESPHVVSYIGNRKFLALFVIFVCFRLNCPAQSVVDFYLTQFTGNTNDTTINVQAANNPIIYNGQYFWWPQHGTNIATTNGFASLSLVPGKYTVSIASVSTAWTITVTNSATALNAAYLTTQIMIYNGINSLSGAGVTTDGHGNYTVIGIGSATNFVSGQNTTWTNIGGNNQVNITGTLTNNTTGSAAMAATATTATNAMTVIGSQSNIIATAMTNYPNVLSFLGANTNLSTEAQNELNAYSRELALQGQLTNLVDLIPFNPRFNPGSNSLSFMGRTVWCSNVVWTAHGVSGSAGGQIVISNMPDLRTNTLVITWRFPKGVTSIAQYFLAGAVDPVSFNSDWMYNGPWPSAMVTQGSTQTSISGGGYPGLWNSYLGNAYSYNYWASRKQIRHVSVLSFSNGIFQCWDNGVQVALSVAALNATSLGSYGTYSSGVTLANPLTTVMLFQAPGIQNGIPGGFNGEIESVQVFKSAATSNLVLAAWWAANELENENTWYTFITDSQGSPDESASQGYTNYPVYYWANNGHHANQVCWDHFGLAGQYNYDYTNPITVYRVSTLYSPHGRFTTEKLTYALNINDLYNGWTALQIWPFYTNWSAICIACNVQMNVVNTSQVSTNGYAGGYAYSPTVEIQRELFNSILMTNSFLFARVLDKDSMVSQYDLNTNNLFSLEGLHFIGPMGWVKNQQYGQLMDNEVNQSPLNYTNGIH